MDRQPEVTPLTEMDGTSDELRALLRQAQQGGGPSEAQLARLSARLAPAVGLPLASLSGALPAAGVAPASTAALGSGGGGASLAPAAGAAKVGVGAKAVLGKLGVGALVKAVGLAGAVGLGVATYGAMQPDQGAPVSAPAQPAAVQHASPSAPSTPVAPTVEVTPLDPAPQVEPEPAAQAEAPAPSERVAPPPPHPARRHLHDGPGVQPEPPSELALMQQAQQQRGQPARLLRTLAQHARLYPGGMLAQERDVLRIEALVKLGRLEEARRSAAQMERTHPESPHLVRVRALLADAP